MPFDYEANIAAVENALNGYNTTTSNPDLSSGLTPRISNVYVSDPEVAAIRWDQLPAIFIRTQAASEEAAGLGATGPLTSHVRKFKEVTYELVCMFTRDGAHTSLPAHETQVYRFAENAEGVFQREFTLSGTALWCHPERTDFGAFQLGDGLRVRGVVVSLKAKYLFQ